MESAHFKLLFMLNKLLVLTIKSHKTLIILVKNWLKDEIKELKSKVPSLYTMHDLEKWACNKRMAIDLKMLQWCIKSNCEISGLQEYAYTNALSNKLCKWWKIIDALLILQCVKTNV